MLIEITPGQTHFMMNGVLYNVSSVIDEHNVRAVVIHPAAARGQGLPPNISVDRGFPRRKRRSQRTRTKPSFRPIIQYHAP
jgi:hypothetical protein